MGVDKSYGSGYKNTGKAKPTTARQASASLRRKNIKRVAANPLTKIAMGEFRRTGKLPDRNQVLEAGVNPYSMIASAILKGVARLLKPSTGTALEGAAKITAANQAKFNASIFNAAARTPAARGAVNRVVRNAVTRAAGNADDSLFIGKASQDVIRLGEEISDYSRLYRDAIKMKEYDVVNRGISKILGNMGRTDPVYRQIGRDFRNASSRVFERNYANVRRINSSVGKKTR